MLSQMTTEERREYFRELGRRGGNKTAQNPENPSKAGKEGFKALAMRLGDNGAAVSFLQKHRGMAKKPRSEWTHNKSWNMED